MLGLKAGGSSPTFLLDEFLSQCIIVFIVFLPQWEKKKSGQTELQLTDLRKVSSHNIFQGKM